MSRWTDLRTEIGGVRKAAQNVDTEADLARYVYDRSSAYVGADHESIVVQLICHALEAWNQANGEDGEALGTTPGPWRVPGANVFRVVAPEAPHENQPSGMCPPYPWAIVAECDPGSVGGEQAAANARLIASLHNRHVLASPTGGE